MLPHLLAQSAPDPTTLASWLSVLFYLGGFIATVIGALVGLKSLRAKQAESMPQPLIVEAAAKYASHVEFTELKNDVEQIRQDVQAGFKALGDERRNSVGNLHSKIDSTNEKVDEMRGEVKHLNQQVQQLVQLQLSNQLHK